MIPSALRRDEERFPAVARLGDDQYEGYGCIYCRSYGVFSKACCVDLDLRADAEGNPLSKTYLVYAKDSSPDCLCTMTDPFCDINT